MVPTNVIERGSKLSLGQLGCSLLLLRSKLEAIKLSQVVSET